MRGGSFQSRSARSALLLGVAMAAFVAAPPAAAQDGPAVEPTIEELGQLLRERGREAMHEGDPLVLEGIDQGDAGFRARTPLFLQSERTAVMVDQEAMRARRLALFAGGTVSHDPLPRHEAESSPSTSVPDAAAAASPAEETEKKETPARRVGKWFFLSAFALLAAGLVLLKRGLVLQSG